MNITEVLKEIRKMEEYDDLMGILKAATTQWNSLFPDWEIVIMSVPRNDPAEKKRLIEQTFALIDREAAEREAGTYPYNA